MKIIAFEEETGYADLACTQKLLKEEADCVYNLYLSGKIREIYFSEHRQAVIILECAGMEEANDVLQSMPLVKNGIISFKVLQLLPYTGYSRLFG